jgi:hypothetical protein
LDKKGKPTPQTPTDWIQYYIDEKNNNILAKTEEPAEEKADVWILPIKIFLDPKGFQKSFSQIFSGWRAREEEKIQEAGCRGAIRRVPWVWRRIQPGTRTSQKIQKALIVDGLLMALNYFWKKDGPGF